MKDSVAELEPIAKTDGDVVQVVEATGLGHGIDICVKKIQLFTSEDIINFPLP